MDTLPDSTVKGALWHFQPNEKILETLGIMPWISDILKDRFDFIGQKRPIIRSIMSQAFYENLLDHIPSHDQQFLFVGRDGKLLSNLSVGEKERHVLVSRPRWYNPIAPWRIAKRKFFINENVGQTIERLDFIPSQICYMVQLSLIDEGWGVSSAHIVVYKV